MTSFASDVTLSLPDKAFVCLLGALFLRPEQITDEFLITIGYLSVMPSWFVTNTLILIFAHVKLAILKTVVIFSHRFSM